MARKRKGTATRRIAIRTAEDNSPTPERMGKADYETVGATRKGSAVRSKANVVLALHRSGDISGDAVTAANWWYADYVFAADGVIQSARAGESESGDIHTFALARGYASARITAIRERLGVCAHWRLQLLLIDGLSLTAMGSILFPGIDEKRGRDRAAAQAAFVLEQLAGFYRQERTRRKVDNQKMLRTAPERATGQIV